MMLLLQANRNMKAPGVILKMLKFPVHFLAKLALL